MSDDKKVKYEFDTHLPSLKKKSGRCQDEGTFQSSQRWLSGTSSRPILDKQNVVIRIIDHLKERF